MILPGVSKSFLLTNIYAYVMYAPIGCRWTLISESITPAEPIPFKNNLSRQIYEFFLNVSKGSVDSTDLYGQLRWDTASVRVQVRVSNRVILCSRKEP